MGDRVGTGVFAQLPMGVIRAGGFATLAAAASLALLGAGGSARAAGLCLTEMATPDMGRASAGRAAIADDAATAFTNPAGMTRLKGTHLLAGLQGGFGNVRFDRGSDTTVSGGNGGNAPGAFPGAGLYAVHSLTPDLRIGLSLGSSFGGLRACTRSIQEQAGRSTLRGWRLQEWYQYEN
jgi:long-subunit fatty acid transport protein